MKKIFNGANIQAVVLLTLTIVETIIMIICKPISIGHVIVALLISLLAISCIRFAYYYALLSNKLYSRIRRANWNDNDDEPSDFAVGSVKAAGYMLLIVQTILMFL